MKFYDEIKMTPLQFQIIDLQTRDTYQKSNTKNSKDQKKNQYSRGRKDGSATDNEYKPRQYCVHLFGVTPRGQSIRADITGFKPYFYVRLPEENTKHAKKSLEDYLERRLSSLDGAFQDITFEDMKAESFMGFTARSKFPFVRLIFPSNWLFREVKKFFLDDLNRPSLGRGKTSLGTEWEVAPFFGIPHLYEANIDPMLRFLHLTESSIPGQKGLAPCGWVSIDDMEDFYEDNGALGVIEADWADIRACSAPPGCPVAPFLKAFWDIECYSESGEFPLARRTWRKVGQNLLSLWRDEKVCSVEDIHTEISSAVHGNSQHLPRINNTSVKTNFKEQSSELATKVFKTLSEIRRGVLSDDEYGVVLDKLENDIATTYGKYIKLYGDPVIQIGVVLTRSGGSDARCFLFTWRETAPIAGTEIHCYESETAMLDEFASWIVNENPDELVGYNTFGFDERYVWNRLEELGLVGGENDEINGLSRMLDLGVRVKLNENRLSSSALGDNFLYTWATPGRLQVDLYHYVKRSGASLPSYKLDEVAKHYMSGKVKQVVCGDDDVVIVCSGAVRDVKPGRFLVLMDDTGESVCHKIEVCGVELKDSKSGKITCSLVGLSEDEREILGDGTKWAIVKDDITPAEIFRKWDGTPEDRALVGKYCVQDCDLVLELYKKLEVFNNSMSMANVCSVPLSFIFMRGQGVKIESLIFKECGAAGSLIPVLESAGFGASASATANMEQGETDGEKPVVEDSYEGAIVLDPIPGFYKESPIGVCDFASLYPSTIDSENISHDMLVWVRDFTDDGTLIENVWGSDEYADCEGYCYLDIEFDLLRPDPQDKRKNPEKIRCGTRICRYAQPLDGTKGLLPMIIRKLLAARKSKRKEAEREENPERKALLDAEQLAYKLTANSLYGQLGSKTFKIRLVYLAASVTAYARKQLLFSKAAIEKFYGMGSGRVDCEAKIMYGDTDSLFVEMNPRGGDGQRLVGRDARQRTIELTQEMGHLVTKALKAPHDFEFDKIFDPFLMFSKKRYVGKMFEENADDYVVKPMGIALKRRDNAPIAKTVFKGAMMELLDRYDVGAAAKFVKETLGELVAGKTSLGQLTITKSLRAEYANENGVAHKVLANRIALRDPGNAPAAGDRIPYVYIRPSTGQLPGKLQGDRIETPSWVREKGLVPDYQFYITNQIQNPVCEMFALVVEQLPGFTSGHRTYLSGIADSSTRLVRAAEVASEILLNDALSVCAKSNTKSFVTKFFGNSSGTNKDTRNNGECKTTMNLKVTNDTIAGRTRSKMAGLSSASITKKTQRKIDKPDESLKDQYKLDRYIMDRFLEKSIDEVIKVTRKVNKKNQE